MFAGAAEIVRVVAAAALALMPDLHQELAVARELQDLRVLVAAAAEPDVVLIVHVDAVLELRPLVAGARAAPRRDERAVGVEFEHRRRGAPDRSRLVRLQRRRAMGDPDVVARIDGDADDRADDPVVRQRLRPGGIDAEKGRRDLGRDRGRRPNGLHQSVPHHGSRGDERSRTAHHHPRTITRRPRNPTSRTAITRALKASGIVP